MSLSPPRLPGPWPDGPGKTPIRSLRSLTGVFEDGCPNLVGRSNLKSRSAPQQRDFIAQRGHAPRNALCEGILSPRGGSCPTLVSPAGLLWLSAPRPPAPSRAHTLKVSFTSQAREGDFLLKY